MKKQALFFTGFSIWLNFAFTQSWQLLNTGTTNGFVSVQATDNNTCYALSPASGLYKSINAGTSWSALGVPIAYNFYFTDNNNGFAVRDSLIMRSTNGGVTWSNVYSGSSIKFLDVQFPTSNVGYAVGIDTTMFGNFGYQTAVAKTTDGGATWSLVTYVPEEIEYFKKVVYFKSIDTGYVCTFMGTYKTTNGGSTWTLDVNAPRQNIRFLNANFGYGIDDSFTLYKTYNAGNTWTTINLSSTGIEIPSDVYFITPDTGFIVSYNFTFSGKLHRSVNGGINWQQQITSSNPIYSVHFYNNTTGYAAGENGKIYKYGSTVGWSEISNTEILMNIYPNPTTSILNINILQNITHGMQCLIYDISGKEVFNNTIINNQLTIDLSPLENGIYFLELGTANKHKRIKIVKL